MTFINPSRITQALAGKLRVSTVHNDSWSCSLSPSWISCHNTLAMHVFSLDSSWFAQHCLKKFGIRREGFLKSRAQIKTINYASNASEVQMEALFGQNLPSSAPAQWWTQSSPGDCFQRTCGEKTILYIDSLKPHGLASDWWLHFQRLARNSMQNI